MSTYVNCNIHTHAVYILHVHLHTVHSITYILCDVHTTKYNITWSVTVICMHIVYAVTIVLKDYGSQRPLLCDLQPFELYSHILHCIIITIVACGPHDNETHNMRANYRHSYSVQLRQRK